MEEDPKPGRRALVLGTAVGGCLVAAAAGGPALALVLAPLDAQKTGKARWVRVIALEKLKENEPRRVAILDDRRDAWTIERGVELGSVWLVRRGAAVTALSAVCPHLGCSVNAETTGSFGCPCHTSSFDAGGKRTGGPSPRDMDTLATKIEDGQVLVDFRKFRIGIEEKVET